MAEIDPYANEEGEPGDNDWVVHVIEGFACLSVPSFLAYAGNLALCERARGIGEKTQAFDLLRGRNPIHRV